MDMDYFKTVYRIGGRCALALLLTLFYYCEKQGIIDPVSEERSKQVRIAEFESSRANIIAGGASSEISLKLLDGTGAPVNEGIVSFNALIGSVTPVDTTDDKGIALALYTSGTISGGDTVTAFFDNTPDTAVTSQIFLTILPQLSISISANPTEIPADGTSSSELTAIVKNELNNPIENAEITFTTNLGRIPASSVTDEFGVATISLFADRTDGIATVTATYQEISVTTKIKFAGTQLIITANPAAVVADGVSTSAIEVTIKDGSELPIEAAEIVLTTDVGTFSNGSTTITGITDVNGVFVDSLKSDIDEIATITASGVGTESSATVSFTNFITTLTADNASIIAGDSVQLVFLITEIDETPVEGIQVLFFTTLGDVVPANGVTGSDGNAKTKLTSTLGGTATVTAQVTGSSITPDAPSVMIIVESAPPENVRLFVDPVVIPVNGGLTNLTAIVTDESGNPVPGQTVSFQILQGPGGGESVDPAFSVTDETGSARSVFQAGSIGSESINSIVVNATIQGTSLSDEAQFTIAGEPKSIKTSPSPPPTDNQDGTFSLAIGSIISDINGNPVNDGTLIHFSTNPPIGVIISPIATTEGLATTNLVYPNDAAGSAVTIVATSGEVTDTLVISQLPTAGVAGFVDSIRVIGSPSGSVIADGQTSTNFEVIVIDPTKNPVAGVIVNFSSVPGNSGSGLTGEQTLADGTQNPDWGIAALSVRSISLKEDVFPEINIEAGGKNVTFQKNNIPDSGNPFFFRGITIDATVSKDTIIVGESINIRTILKETTSNVALSGRSVTFGASLGLMTNSDNTDSRGEINTTFEAGTDSGLALITATFGTNIIDSVFVYIAEEDLSPKANIFLTADTSFVNVQNSEGLTSTIITARITNASNDPVQSVSMQLTTSLGNFFVETSPGNFTLLPTVILDTDALGEVKATLLGGPDAGVATITASGGGVTVSKALVTVQAGLPESIVVSSDTLGVISEGNFLQINVVALVSDTNGNPVATGTPVSFSTEFDGSGDEPIVSIVASGSTDAFGIATSTLTYTVSDISLGIRATVSGVTVTKDIKLPVIQQ